MIKKQYGDVMMVGQSGNKYRFGTWPLGTRFRPVPAVYFVSKRFVQETTFRRARHEVIFIGETENMSEVPGAHVETRDFEKFGANCICLFANEDKDVRMDIVRDLVLSNRPLMRQTA